MNLVFRIITEKEKSKHTKNSFISISSLKSLTGLFNKKTKLTPDRTF